MESDDFTRYYIISYLSACELVQLPPAPVARVFPLCRAPFSYFVCMRTRCLVLKPKTLVICLGVRLVHTQNHALTNMAQHLCNSVHNSTRPELGNLNMASLYYKALT